MPFFIAVGQVIKGMGAKEAEGSFLLPGAKIAELPEDEEDYGEEGAEGAEGAEDEPMDEEKDEDAALAAAMEVAKL